MPTTAPRPQDAQSTGLSVVLEKGIGDACGPVSIPARGVDLVTPSAIVLSVEGPSFSHPLRWRCQTLLSTSPTRPEPEPCPYQTFLPNGRFCYYHTQQKLLAEHSSTNANHPLKPGRR